MLSAKDVRGVTFSKQVNGYRREEVDVFLDKVEADYEAYERTLREANAKIHKLETQLAENKSSEGSIQNVLISAQKLADKIVAEAKEKSAAIIDEAKANLEVLKNREKELSGTFEQKAQERKKIARDALDKIIDEAKENRDKISLSVEKTVKKQTDLYNRLKLETAAFKAEIMDKYKKQLELISKIPDSIPTSPEEIAAAVDFNVDDLSDRERFIKEIEAKPIEVKADEDISIIEEIAQAQQPKEADKPQGFVVNAVSDGEEEE